MSVMYFNSESSSQQACWESALKQIEASGKDAEFLVFSRFGYSYIKGADRVKALTERGFTFSCISEEDGLAVAFSNKKFTHMSVQRKPTFGDFREIGKNARVVRVIPFSPVYSTEQQYLFSSIHGLREQGSSIPSRFAQSKLSSLIVIVPQEKVTDVVKNVFATLGFAFHSMSSQPKVWECGVFEISLKEAASRGAQSQQGQQVSSSVTVTPSSISANTQPAPSQTQQLTSLFEPLRDAIEALKKSIHAAERGISSLEDDIGKMKDRNSKMKDQIASLVRPETDRILQPSLTPGASSNSNHSVPAEGKERKGPSDDDLDNMYGE